ncbi:MAG: hypothetical protein JWM82_827 [Myxococcales bacterium]|nr:hypothetical protein [Myxococcales bacterium]
MARRWSSFVVGALLVLGSSLAGSSVAAAQGAAPPAPEGKHGFLAMFYLGAHHFFGDYGANRVDTGFRIGTILGGRLTPQISLNGEITLDVLNPKNVPPGLDVTGLDADIAFSPLFHVPSGRMELVVGPKLGLRAAAAQTNGGVSTSSSTNGYTAGINAGLFGAVTPGTSLGALLNFEVRTHDESCVKVGDFPESCSTQNQGSAEKLLGITLAVLF